MTLLTAFTLLIMDIRTWLESAARTSPSVIASATAIMKALNQPVIFVPIAYPPRISIFLKVKPVGTTAWVCGFSFRSEMNAASKLVVKNPLVWWKGSVQRTATVMTRSRKTSSLTNPRAHYRAAPLLAACAVAMKSI